MFKEEANNKECTHDPKTCNGDRANGPSIFPADVLLRQIITACQVGQGPLSKTAVSTGKLIMQVLVGLTRDTDPAAHISRLHTLHLILPAGVTTLGGGHNITRPGNQAVVQAQALSPVADFTVDIAFPVFVIVKNVVTTQAVSKSIKADYIVSVWRTKGG